MLKFNALLRAIEGRWRVIPWEHLDTAAIPGGEGDMRLKRRGREFSIMLGKIELMNSRLSGSEEALARLTAVRLRGHKAPRVLIGGLGMGFTLRAALTEYGQDATIIVSELVPAVVTWARGPMAALYGGSLDDPRASIVTQDVGEVMRDAARDPATRFDAILMDVDNGPEGLTRISNDRLYDDQGLAQAGAALKPHGVLAVWSCEQDTRFTARLKRCGYSVEEATVRAFKGIRGAKHTIWLARR